jgi:hypothetical protein
MNFYFIRIVNNRILPYLSAKSIISKREKLNYFSASKQNRERNKMRNHRSPCSKIFSYANQKNILDKNIKRWNLRLCYT